MDANLEVDPDNPLIQHFTTGNKLPILCRNRGEPVFVVVDYRAYCDLVLDRVAEFNELNGRRNLMTCILQGDQ